MRYIHCFLALLLLFALSAGALAQRTYGPPFGPAPDQPPLSPQGQGGGLGPAPSAQAGDLPSWAIPANQPRYPAWATDPNQLPPPRQAVEQASALEEVEELGEADVDVWYKPSAWVIPNWDASFEIGINGSSGNAEAFSLTAGANIKRETEKHKIEFDVIHNRATANSISTQNNLLGTLDYERLLGDSPWSFFAKGMGEYDEFKAFDMRLAANGGVGYKFIEAEHMTLNGRFGAGVSHEIGGPDDSYVPEAVFGLDYDHQLTERQKFVITIDYFPEFGDFMNFRVVADASWEILLDEATDMSLKIGIIDRYDSTPNGLRPNDLDYSLLLLWKL